MTRETGAHSRVVRHVRRAATIICKTRRASLSPSTMPRLKAPQRREQLMEVATKLFARNGYEATTTAAIAEMAGVTEPILYRHFRSKQELFVAIVKAVSDRTLRHWEDISKG